VAVRLPLLLLMQLKLSKITSLLLQRTQVNKVSAIHNMPKPANKDEVRRFLSMVT